MCVCILKIQNGHYFRDEEEKRANDLEHLNNRMSELNTSFERLRDHVTIVEQEKTAALTEKEASLTEMINLRLVYYLIYS